MNVLDQEHCQVTSSKSSDSHREGLPTEHRTPVERYEQLVADGRLEMLPTGTLESGRRCQSLNDIANTIPIIKLQ